MWRSSSTDAHSRVDLDRRRGAERQQEAEHRAAVGAVGRCDRAAVRLDDRLADRQPEADARDRRFARATRELLEDRRFLPGPDARPVVGDGDAQRVAVHSRRDPDAGRGRRVLRGVLEQVDEHTLDQHRVALDERQI